MASNESFIHMVHCEEDWGEMFYDKGGIFFGENPLLRVFSFTMMRLCMFFFISSILHRVLRPLKQPTYVCNTLAAIILGPTVLGRFKNYQNIADIPSQLQFINFGANLGLVYYVFITAVKTDSEMVFKFGKQIWFTVVLSMFAPFLVMTALLIFLHPISFKVPRISYVFIIQLSSTWFINLAPMLEELNLLTTEFGQLSLSLALANELIMWFIAILLVILKSLKSGILLSILPITTIVVLTVIVRPTMLWLAKNLPRGEPVKEKYVIGILLGALIIACVSDILIGSAVIGVAFFGLVVPSGPPLGLAITERGETLIRTCLLPFFYLAVGEMTNLHEIIDLKGHLLYQLIIIVGYLTKIVSTTLCSTWYNISIRQALALGLIMNTSGVIHIATYWSNWLRQLSAIDISSQLVLSSVIITSLVTPLALQFHKKTKKQKDSIIGFQLSLQSTLSSSKMHILACIDSEEDILGFISLLKASNPTQLHPMCVYIVHLVELVGQAAPTLVPHKKHKRICQYNGCVPIMSALKSFCNATDGGINVQLLTMIAPFLSIHEGICKLAEDKMIPLIIVPYVYKTQSHSGKMSISSQVNRKLQEHTPCTIGILVDRDINKKQLSQSSFSYHVAVIFCGGEDDREALSFAIRMSTHPGVSITMLRILIQDYPHMKEDDESLDKSLVDLFKGKIACNACAVYREINVKDLLQALNVLKTLDKGYDLVMVGHRHGVLTSTDEDEMYVHTDKSELGHVGETLVCDELQWENTSVLVMQHCTGFDSDNFGNFAMLDDNIC